MVRLYDGLTFSHHKQDQNGRQTMFTAKSGDRVGMEVDLVQCTLVVVNKSKNNGARVVLDFKKQENNPLHFCVLMY